jgi:glycosyltransferase involved in cell wall biosynthesis
MRVIIIHQYFRTPEEGGGIRSYYLAKGLLAKGHDVEIITAHNDKTITKHIEGITVHYLPVYYDNKLGAISRIWAFVKFVILAINKACLLPKGNINYAISTPLSVGIIALTLRVLRRTPYIFEIGDLWPEAPIQLGYIKNIFLKNLLYWFEKYIYCKSRNIVAMSPDIERYVLNTQPADKVIMIPNMSDCDFYYPSDKSRTSLDKFDVAGKFVIAYIGTAGRANHLEYLVDAAEASNLVFPQVQFLVASSGRELSRMKNLVDKAGLSNIRFINYLDRAGVKELLNITDAVYVSFANVPILSSGSPNKFFDGLAAGKLIITNFGGWTKDIIEKHECGFSYNSEEANTFSEQLAPYLKSEELLLKSKNNARQVAEKHYSRNGLIEEWMKLFDIE